MLHNTYAYCNPYEIITSHFTIPNSQQSNTSNHMLVTETVNFDINHCLETNDKLDIDKNNLSNFIPFNLLYILFPITNA